MGSTPCRATRQRDATGERKASPLPRWCVVHTHLAERPNSTFQIYFPLTKNTRPLLQENNAAQAMGDGTIP